MPARIEDYALIGDLATAALVSRGGSIDWLCWPRFDSDACLSALLGTPAHGRWLIAPVDPAGRVTRRYRPNTLILETRFDTEQGAVTIIDFMPPRENPARSTGSHVVRIVAGERGSVAMRSELVLRFGYGASVPWVTRMDDGTLRAIAGPDMAVVRTPVRMHGEDFKTVANFTVAAGERIPFVMSYAPSHRPLPEPLDVEAKLQASEQYWRGWAGKNKISGPWNEAVCRSLITLKALTYAPTGGMVAAPTTSLPEQIGGPRNWDYRFCWLRDATFTLYSLLSNGYVEEAAAFRNWLLRAIAGSPEQVQIMYSIDGRRRLTELELDWLAGYEGSKPVRIGNAAWGQLQLDIYGETIDLLHVCRRQNLEDDENVWRLELAFLRYLEKAWAEPDEGIW